MKYEEKKGSPNPPPKKIKNKKIIITSWDELISPRLRQLAWVGLEAVAEFEGIVRV
jgi:hypothetical protein